MPEQWSPVRTVPISPYFTAREHARFRAKYERRDEGHGTECWVWTASTKGNGYGEFSLGGKMLKAHRVSYAWNAGPIPDGLTLDHLCRNRACVNPHHLEPVSMRENTLRGKGPSAACSRKDRCKHGHPFTEENTWVGGQRRRCRTCDRDRKRREYWARAEEAAGE